MIAELEFIIRQIVIMTIYLDHFIGKMNATLPREQLAVLNITSNNANLCIGELAALSERLSELNRLLIEYNGTDPIVKERIVRAKERLDMSPSNRVLINELLDDCYRFNEHYSSEFRSQFPELLTEVRESAQRFQSISVNRYNYDYFIEKLKGMSEETERPGMISLIRSDPDI